VLDGDFEAFEVVGVDPLLADFLVFAFEPELVEGCLATAEGFEEDELGCRGGFV
jgi:hypothetical protein